MKTAALHGRKRAALVVPHTRQVLDSVGDYRV
jgi:hypothetical protein